MLTKNLEPIKDKDHREILEHILQEAFGNPISLTSAPTAAAPLLNANEWGLNSTNIWFRVGNILNRVAVDEQLTVT